MSPELPSLRVSLDSIEVCLWQEMNLWRGHIIEKAEVGGGGGGWVGRRMLDV